MKASPHGTEFPGSWFRMGSAITSPPYSRGGAKGQTTSTNSLLSKGSWKLPQAVQLTSHWPKCTPMTTHNYKRSWGK